MVSESQLAHSYLNLEEWWRSLDTTLRLKFTATDLKNKTGQILDEILRCKTILVEKHGRPIAEIRPVGRG